MRRAAVALLLIGTAMLASPRADVGLDPAVQTVLARALRFSSSDFADLARGKTVKHTLETNAAGEVAVAGAVRVNATVDHLLQQMRDIVSFKRDADVLEIGRFGSPPTLGDLSGLTISRDDLDARDCRPKNCDVRLPARDITRFQTDIDWRSPDATARAAALFKTMLFDHVHAYWTGGTGRIDAYEDDERPIRPALEFAGILDRSGFLRDLVPELPMHLREFPRTPAPGAEDFLYWSKERFGIAPFITVTHVTIARTASGAAVVTSKDVYSSRYFDSSLGTTIAADTGSGHFLLVYVNRSRANALKGPFSSLRRALVERRAKGSLDAELRQVRSRLEAAAPRP